MDPWRGDEGSTSTSFPPGTFADSWEGGKSTSAAGKAFFKITYGQRNWDIGFKIETNETAFAGSQLVLNWNSTMAGLYLETGLGMKPDAGILGAFPFGKLTAWWVVEQFKADQLNHWETGGAVANWLSLGDIPVPGGVR